MNNLKEEINVLWEYLHMNHKIEKSDVILVCGGHDSGVANQAAKLYKDKYAPVIVVSGGIYRKIFGIDKKVLESDLLGDLIHKSGVPLEDILFERKSKNTGENLDFSEKLLLNKGYKFDNIILVQKPYAERRAWCLAKKKWKDKKIIMCSESLTREEYFNVGIPEEKIISMMVGEIQRLVYSPKFGWIDNIDIPNEVLNAYDKICSMGYTERLMSDEIIRKCMIGTQDNISINSNKD